MSSPTADEIKPLRSGKSGSTLLPVKTIRYNICSLNVDTTSNESILSTKKVNFVTSIDHSLNSIDHSLNSIDDSATSTNVHLDHNDSSEQALVDSSQLSQGLTKLNITSPVSPAENIAANSNLAAESDQKSEPDHKNVRTLTLLVRKDSGSSRILNLRPNYSSQPQQHLYESQIIPNQNLSFKIKFPYADVFANLIRFLCGGHGKLASNRSYFEISPQTFEYRGIDSSGAVINHTEIFAENTTLYYVEPDQKAKIFVSLRNLNSLTSSYRKDMPVTLSKMSGDKCIFIATGNNSGDNSGGSAQNVQYLEQLNLGIQNDITIPDSEYNFDKPNAVITATGLKDMCRTLKTDTNVHIRGTIGSIAFAVVNDGRTLGGGWIFHSNDPQINSSPENKTYITQGFINGPIIKNLSHLEKLAPTGIIKVYIQNARQIKLVAPISYIGYQSIYITLTPSGR